MSSLPAEIDFVVDRAASPDRMNRAMGFLDGRLRLLEAFSPQYQAAIDTLRSIGLERLTEALGPIFDNANELTAQIDALRQEYEEDAFKAAQAAEVLAILRAGVPTEFDTLAKMADKLSDYRSKYLGSRSGAPTIDDNGDPVATGAMYFDTVLGRVRVYNGVGWADAGSVVNGVMERQSATATGGQTTFAVPGGYDPGNIIVAKNGLTLSPAQVTVTSGTNIVLAAGATNGDVISWVKFSSLSLANAYTIAQADAIFATKANATDVYTVTNVDTLLAAKANANAVYSIAAIDNALSGKADVADVYNKSASDARYVPAGGLAGYGLPASAIISNLDTFYQSGFYKSSSTATGRPSGLASGHVLVVSEGSSGTDTLQIFISAGSDRALYRRRTGAAWSSWVEHAPLASPAFTGTPTAPTAAPGTNTTQLATTAYVLAALTALAPLASPAFTGTPTAPTQAQTDNSTRLATTAYVRAAVAALLDTAPGTLDTLNELAVALGNDPNFATTISTALGLKAPLASPALTGTPTAPTVAGTSDSTTKIATTAFVQGVAALKASLASPTFTGTPAGPTPSSVDNSTRLATTAFVQALLAGLAPLASPTFTGTPSGPTAAGGTNTTQLATCAFVVAAIGALAPLASPAFTGNPTAPTQTTGNNTTRLATTAFVQAAITALVDSAPSTLNTLNKLAAALGNDAAFSTTVTNALALKAPLASPALTDTPAAPTVASAADNTTKIATTAFVQAALAALVDAAPAALNTLNELAEALGDDPNFATTVTNALALKAPLASPALTGTPTAPTQAAGNNSTRLATTAFVQAAIPGAFTASQLLGANGYQVEPGGLIKQWGVYTGGSNHPSIDFPIPFPAACYGVQITPMGYGNATDEVGVNVHHVTLDGAATTTGFSAWCSSEWGSNDVFNAAATTQFYWEAKGR